MPQPDRSEVLVSGKFITEEEKAQSKQSACTDLHLRQHLQYSSKCGLQRFQLHRRKSSGRRWRRKIVDERTRSAGEPMTERDQGYCLPSLT